MIVQSKTKVNGVSCSSGVVKGVNGWWEGGRGGVGIYFVAVSESESKRKDSLISEFCVVGVRDR